jgi:hypothetical protein
MAKKRCTKGSRLKREPDIYFDQGILERNGHRSASFGLFSGAQDFSLRLITEPGSLFDSGDDHEAA